ncbi:MAG: hypothetical protein GEU78_13370 [Actinobacteria bacterium]|nr:hypothetical protein [Actinomycetota bacterium]
MGAIACDRDAGERDSPRASGRVVDEPFADLIVTAGPSPEDSRLYALDLLNLELDRIAPHRVTRIVGRCDGRPIIEAVVGGARRLMELRGRALIRSRRTLRPDRTCRSSRADRHIPGWVSHEQVPGGERIFLTDGRRVAVAKGDDIEVLGRTRLPIWSAIWARR